jgi:protein-S-isoprenylcysteine O-methyltransferase Ste14
MVLGQLDLVFLTLRTLTGLILIVAAVLSVRLMMFYKGGVMERTWLSLLVGIVFFAVAQPVAAVAEVFESDLFRVLASIAALLGGLLICWGLYRTLRAWRKLAENPQRSERVA